ncbi:unnamed protein product, partial [Prunus brigantina]
KISNNRAREPLQSWPCPAEKSSRPSSSSPTNSRARVDFYHPKTQFQKLIDLTNDLVSLEITWN